MLPKIHLVIGILFISLTYLFFPNISKTGLLIILASSVLIDADHCIYYFIQEKDISIKKCYAWHKKHLKETLALPMSERKKKYTGFYIFHGIEWLVILFLLSIFVFPNFIFIFIGFLLHGVVDISHEYYIKRTLHKSSLIYSYIQWKKLEG